MTKHQSMNVDHGADVNLSILTSLLIDVRDLVMASQEFGQESGVVASSPSYLLEELGDTLASLRISNLLMICTAWLIDRISIVSTRASHGEIAEMRGEKSLKERFDDSGCLKNVPVSGFETKVRIVCMRLARLDSGRS